MKGRELQNLGIPKGPKVKLAMRLLRGAAESGLKKRELRAHLKEVVAAPADHTEHPYFSDLARALCTPDELDFIERAEPAPWKQWGTDLDDQAIKQINNACRLPVSVAGALMPDAHTGYGLPIGGVLATENAVIPYAVGVDIACRMKMTVLDMPAQALKGEKQRLINVLEDETAFGIGASFRKPHDHEVMDQDWNITEVTRNMKGKARSQLGSSGSGNHFVEFGTLTLTKDDLGLKAGTYLALLSHSGSRGPGANVASHYSKLAQALHPELPKELKHLAWLDMDSEEGQEYWAAMNLMGDFAAANHAVIHREIVRALGAKALADVENHHNFCIVEDAIVPTPKGPKQMGKLEVGDVVYAFDEKEGMVETKVEAHWCSGHKEILEIRTPNRCIECSPEHPFLTISVDMKAHPERPWMNKSVGRFEWKKAEELSEGDILVCAEGYYSNQSESSCSPSEARLCGAFLGDGWIRHTNTHISGYGVGLAIGEANENHTLLYEELCRKVLPKATWKIGAKGAFGITCSSKKVHQRVKERFHTLRSRDRTVPSWVFQASYEAKMSFLAGYLDADGSVSANKKNAGRGVVCSVSHELVKGIREIAISCGLTATNITREEKTTNMGPTSTSRFVLSADSTSKIPLWHEGKIANQRQTIYKKNKGLQRSKIGYIDLPEGSFAQTIRKITKAAPKPVYDITVSHESHSFVCEGLVVHNCWQEIHDGREVYVHRKGATPAGEGVLGIIPGSMATPGYVVRGKGNAASLESASHGAGRVMSRRKANESFRWSDVKKFLKERDVTLISAGLDENPGVYKDIDQVMGAQEDLVDTVARFDPKIVKMAPAGERPED